MNTVAEARPAGLWSVEEIEAGVESMLFRQLLRERMCQTPNEVDRELQELALDAFEEWANEYGLPTTPHVLAAYLVELHSEGEEADILEFVAEAYLSQNERDVHVPIRAALQYCSKGGGYKQRICCKKGAFHEKNSGQITKRPKQFKLGHLGTLNQVIVALGKTIRAMADGSVDSQVGSRIANGLGIMRQCLETRTLDQLGERLDQIESTGGAYGTTNNHTTHVAH